MSGRFSFRWFSKSLSYQKGYLSLYLEYCRWIPFAIHLSVHASLRRSSLNFFILSVSVFLIVSSSMWATFIDVAYFIAIFIRSMASAFFSPSGFTGLKLAIMPFHVSDLLKSSSTRFAIALLLMAPIHVASELLFFNANTYSLIVRRLLFYYVKSKLY